MKKTVTESQVFTQFQLASLAWEPNIRCPGRLVAIDQACVSCLASASLEAGCPVLLTWKRDNFNHELLGRVMGCKATANGDYLVRLGMEYSDLETQDLLAASRL